ncbi:ribosomal protein L49/IMG2 [Halteromyces radiatus]|uniref:ribosomal protein L49/IMG2 n=1 Tax=Halteromyces radiatus TaxID=101107 RepID=UPI0022207ECC|nr:ribosomal protein L49/IMG2 [Halteromyces radiatus]KAI8096850.1 ribosomal protein L49/IMG2 [Halteromyces radiatus]
MFRSLLQPISKRYFSSVKDTPYIVSRTSNHSLPVYSDIKNGGTQQLTIIRRIEGDVEALKADLTSLFPDAPKSHVKINPTNNHIIIKGLYVNELKQWLANKGF